jgi:regulator of replication initiation timing
MSEFEFDDVINMARIIARPEQAAAELERLRIEGYRLTQKLAQAQVDLEVKQTLLDESIRKGLQLCEQNGTLLMEAHELKERIGNLETALKCANVCNELADNNRDAAWSTKSPFQKKIEELVGKSPYGEEEKK